MHLVPVADSGGTYLNWSVVHISATNAAIIVAMIVIFVLALVLPFPGHHEDDER